MTHRLDEGALKLLTRTLNERFGEPLKSVPYEAPKEQIVEMAIAACEGCGGMPTVEGDTCTQCGMMPQAIARG
mgnify:CR=1 FL=1